MPSKKRPPPPVRVVSGSDGQVHIQTSRLLLRGAQAQHAKELHKVFSNPEVMEFWSTLPHTKLSETEDWLSKMILSPHNGTTDFIISYNADAIGKIGIWSPNSEKEVPGGELGFLIAKEHQRKGFMTEALRAVLPFYVNDLGYERITADVDPRNDASIALLLQCGFRIIGRRDKTFQIGGKWVDSLDFELRIPPRIVETPESGVLR